MTNEKKKVLEHRVVHNFYLFISLLTFLGKVVMVRLCLLVTAICVLSLSLSD